MSSKPPVDEKDVFNAARKIADAEAREQYLVSACGDDQETLERVRHLLSVHSTKETFLESPAVMEATKLLPVTEKSGDTIGPYKLLQKLGEGGMGTVYLAEQSEPVERRVALKVIKAGMDTRQVISRFEAERQALAIMDHPNIARVLDAGTTDAGRPYFVMDLVKGVPITQYCDEHRLDPRERLGLFQDVCHAVQHAHQKGIIHRDIKPSNVMVAEYDDVAVPKIIDFGVAKATQQRLTEKTVFTEVGTVLGTIEYMSPEQAKLNQLDIDTRSDIYSLGVLLYELLTGETPFDRKKLRSAAFDEMLRIIREEEPSRPSLKLSTSVSLPSIAANRKIDPKRLSTLVRGELDWIVMKALEKDRSRRYDTANAFASDIENYLNDEAVEACPPSAGYRFRKMIRRNKGVALASGLVAAALLFGIASTSWQAWRASQQRDRALIAESLSERRLTAEKAARTDADRARQTESAARIEAQRSAAERRRALVRQYVRRGTDYVDQRDYNTALPWFIKALEIDEDDHASIHRLRIATTMDRCPKLRSILRPEHRVDAIEFFADGRRILLRAEKYNQATSVWDLSGTKAEFPIPIEGFAALNHDGTRIVICQPSGDVIVAESQSGEIIQTIKTDNGRADFAGFDPQSKLIFVVHNRRTIQVWDIASGTAVTPLLDEDANQLDAAKFSTHGRYLVASDDKAGSPDLLLVWDLQQIGPAKRLSWLRFNGKHQMHYLAVGPDFVACPEDVFVGVASLTSGKRLYPHLKHSDNVESVRLSRDNNRLLSCGTDHTARVWQVKDGKPGSRSMEHESPVTVAEFSHDGKLVVTGTVEGEIGIWNSITGLRALPKLRHGDRIWSARFSPDGRYLISSSIDGGTRVWDLATELAAPTLVRQQGTWVQNCEFIEQAGSKPHLIVENIDFRLPTYDLQSKGIVSQAVDPLSGITFARLHPDSKSVVTGGFDGRIARIRMIDGHVLFRRNDFHIPADRVGTNESNVSIGPNGKPYQSTATRAAMDPAGQWIVFHSNVPKNVPTHSQLLAVDANTGEPRSDKLSFDGPVNESVITNDGKYWVGGFGKVFSPYNGCRLEIRSTPGLELVRRIAFQVPIRAVCVSGDGKRIVVGGGKSDRPGFAQVFDFATGKALTPKVMHPSQVEHVRLLAGDTRVLSRSRDGTLQTWDIGNGKIVAPTIRVGRWAPALAVDPQERWLATGTATNNMRGRAEQYLRLWDLQTGEPISPNFPHDNGLFSVALSKNGRQIASCSRDSYVRVFDVPEETRSLNELRSLSIIHSGLVLDELDNEVVVDMPTFEDAWKSLTARYTEEFRASDDEVNAWLRARIKAEHDNATKLSLLDRLILLDPHDAELYRTRIRLNRTLARYEPIPQDVETLQRIVNHTGADLASLASAISREPHPDRRFVEYALQLADRAVERSPEDVITWQQRSAIHRHDDNLDSAIADLEQVTRLQPENYRPWYELALLKLKAGDREGYHQVCHDLHDAIPPTGSMVIEEFVPWTAALGNADVDAWPELIDRARFPAESSPATMSHRNNLGAALLRGGYLAAAYKELIEADRLLRDPSSQMTSSPAYTWYLLATTCKRLGFDDEAKEWFEKAQRWVEQLEQPKQNGGDPAPVAWNRRITLDVLEREAEQILRDGSIPKPPEIEVTLARAIRSRGDDQAYSDIIEKLTAEVQSEPARFWDIVRDPLVGDDVMDRLLSPRRTNDDLVNVLSSLPEQEFDIRLPMATLLRTQANAQQLARSQRWDAAAALFDWLSRVAPEGTTLGLKAYVDAARCVRFAGRMDEYRHRYMYAMDNLLTDDISAGHKRLVATLLCYYPIADVKPPNLVERCREINDAHLTHEPWSNKLLAEALLMDGQAQSAIAVLRQVEGNASGYGRGQTLFLLAMCEKELGNDAKAKDWLKKGDQWTKTLEEAGGSANWVHLPEVKLAQERAHRLLDVPLARETAENSKTPLPKQENETESEADTSPND